MMQRRKFLQAGLAASALTLAGQAAGGVTDPDKAKSGSRDYFELRAYRLKPEASPALLHGYLENALLPALSARGLSNVGVFVETEGKEGSTVWVLISHPSLDSVAEVTSLLNADPTVRANAGNYWKTTSKTNPAFDRMDSWLLLAFAGMPHLNIPALSQKKAPRILELRTYQSFSEERALKKVEMFNSGEIGAMHEVGLAPIFFGQGLLGRDLPHLTYLLSGSDREAHAEHWKGFNAHPVWQKLKADPAYAETVSKVISRFLVPTAYSAL